MKTKKTLKQYNVTLYRTICVEAYDEDDAIDYAIEELFSLNEKDWEIDVEKK